MARPKSSFTDKFNAAENPIKDHSSGIRIINQGTLLSEWSNRPKVNIVVGQGTPKVGDLG